MRNEDGTVSVGRTFTHRVVWPDLYLDTPERQFFTLWAGTNSYLPCGYCKFQGTLTPVGVRPMGYSEPALQDIFVAPARAMYANDPEHAISDG